MLIISSKHVFRVLFWVFITAILSLLAYTLSFLQRTGGDSKALAPHWPKPKDEGWIITLGQLETGELWALKRVAFVKSQLKANIVFVSPETVGKLSL